MWPRCSLDPGSSGVEGEAAFTQPAVRGGGKGWSQVTGGRSVGDGPAGAVRDAGEERSGEWGPGPWAGKDGDSEAGQSQGNQGFGITAKDAGSSPIRSRARRPSAALLAPDY